MSQWYYMSGGQQQGPIAGSQLKSLAASGGLLPDDLVWNESMTEWVAAKRVKGLVFAAQPAAPQPAPRAAPAAPAAPAPDLFPAPSEPAETLPYAGSESQPVTAGTMEILRQSMPWVRIVAILLFVYAGLLLLLGLGGLLVALVGANTGRGSRGGVVAGLGVGFFFVYSVLAAIVFFPGLFLMRYAGGIKRLQQTGRSVELESALGAQRLYFLFTGIVGLVVASIGVILVILQLVGAMVH